MHLRDPRPFDAAFRRSCPGRLDAYRPPVVVHPYSTAQGVGIERLLSEIEYFAWSLFAVETATRYDRPGAEVEAGLQPA